MGVILFSALAELLVRRLNYIRDSARLSNIRVNSFYQAWGPRFYHVLHKVSGAPPVPAEKRVKLSLGSLLDLPVVSADASINADALEKEVRKVAAQGSNSSQLVASGRTTIDILVTREEDGEGIVWTLDDETGEWTELTLNNMQVPSLANSWPVRVGQKAFARLTAAGGSAPNASDLSAVPQMPNGQDSSANATGSNAGNANNAKNRKNNKKR